MHSFREVLEPGYVFRRGRVLSHLFFHRLDLVGQMIEATCHLGLIALAEVV
jgi:hypothetical protein